MKKINIISAFFSLSLLTLILLVTSLNSSAQSLEQTIVLNQGFNFVSFTVNPSVTPTQLKQNYPHLIEDIYSYSAASGSFLSLSEGTLITLSIGKGYIIKSAALDSIKLSGSSVTSVSDLSLKSGFNLIGIPQSVSTNTFSDLMKNFVIIKGIYKWSSFAGSFVQVVSNGGMPQLIDGVDPRFIPGEAYFINVYDDTVLSFSGGSISLIGGTVPSEPSLQSDLVITGTLPSLDAPVYDGRGYMIAHGSNHEIGVVDSETMLEIPGAKVVIVDRSYTATVPAGVLNITALIIIKHKISNKIVYSAMAGVLPTASAMKAASVNKITVSGVDINNESSAMAALAKDKKIDPPSVPVKQNVTEMKDKVKTTVGAAVDATSIAAVQNAFLAVNTVLNSPGVSETVKNNILSSLDTALANILNAFVTALKNSSALVNQTIGSDSVSIGGHIISSATNSNDIESAVDQLEVIRVTEVLNPADIQVPNGTALNAINFPLTAEVLLSNSKTDVRNIFWSVISSPVYNPGIAGTYVFTGIIDGVSIKALLKIIVAEKPQKVANPLINPAGGTFLTTREVSISCATAGAAIKYTADGTAPSETNGTLYSGTFSVTLTSTIKAIAYKNGMINSDVASAIFTMLPTVAIPVITPAGGTFSSTQQVEILCPTAGAVIKYTTDGTLPSAVNGSIYSGKIEVGMTKNIKVIALKEGMVDSNIASAAFVIAPSSTAPTFTPVSGHAFNNVLSITLSCATTGADIYYTTDGTVPTTASVKLTSAINLRATTTIKAISVKNGMSNSNIVTATYLKTSIPAGQSLNISLVGGISIEMVRIPAGTFQMGESGVVESVHNVTISKDYYMGRYEVTQGQWKALMAGENPSYSKNGDNYPVEQVSLDSISTPVTGFLAKINARNLIQGTFRLPTEAEWEYACRAGTTTKYYWGDSMNNDYLWHGENSGNTTHLVGTKLPNAWGLYDMSGNVFEWCSDLMGDGSYSGSAVTDPVGAESGSCVVRGGGWPYSGCYGSAERAGYSSSNISNYFGFRLVLAPLVQVETPVLTHAAGTYISTQEVALSCATTGAVIKYTTDGTAPSETNGSVYSGTISVSLTSTIKAFAYKAGMVNSSVASAALTILQRVEAPVVTPAGGTFEGTRQVEILSSTAGAAIKYTIDGTIPSASNGLTYSGTIEVSAAATIKAIALKQGMADSNISVAAFVINQPMVTYDYIIQPGPEGKDTLYGTVYARNGGYGDHGTIYNGGWGDYYYDFFEFDLTNSPEAVKTVSAKLYIYQTPAVINDAGYKINRVTQSWTEKELTAYNNPSSVFYKDFGPFNSKGWNSVDITDLYIAWKSGNFPNFGIKMVPTNNNMTNSSFATFENRNYSLHPKIIVTTNSPIIRTVNSVELNKIQGYVAVGSTFDLSSNLQAFVHYTDDTTASVDIAGLAWEINSGGGSIAGNIYTAPAATGDTVLKASYTADGVVRNALFNLAVAIPCALPSISPAGASFLSTQEVAITCATEGADIYYTTDGTQPAISSAKYMSPFTLSTTSTVKAIAVKAGLINSEVASAAFQCTAFSIDLGDGVMLEMIRIPAGTFRMGRIANVLPGHTVTISQNYYIGKYEVTQAQWSKIMYGTSPSGLNANYPVAGISRDAIIGENTGFFAKLNAKNLVQSTFRLPTEAEWEYAYRAGTTTRYYWGDSINNDYLWYGENSGNTAHPVGTKLPNAWGIYDMSGNVFEWCDGASEARGGGWAITGFNDSVYGCTPWYASDYYGFRIVLSDPGQVSLPTFTPFGDLFISTQEVTIACATAGAEIYYTTDGTQPTISSAKYTSPFTLSATTTVKAIAVKEGMTNSGVASAVFTLNYLQSPFPTLSIDIGEGVMLDMVKIPAGTFQMGQIGVVEPVHTVTISQDYYIGKYEVTQAQWSKIMYGSAPSGLNDNYPVASISRDAITEETTGFLARLNAKNLVQGTFRLPWEAEWEYAYRAGTTTLYYWGDSMNNNYLWHGENSGNTTHQVGTRLPNAWGLYDMSGNVFEWCGDGASGGASCPVRGGGFPYTGCYDAVSYGGYASWSVSDYFGFRIVLTVPGKVSIPAINPPYGSMFFSTQEVSMACETAGADIYYTMDGTTPTTSSIKYTAPFILSETTTIESIAVKAGLTDSSVMSATYSNVTTPPLMPLVTYKPGFEVMFGNIVTILLDASDVGRLNAVIKYTTDGTTPSADNGLIYIRPFNMPLNSVFPLNAIVIDGSLTSPILTRFIVIDAPKLND